MAKGRGKRERRDATGDDSDSLKPLSNDLLPKGTISSFSRGGYDDAAKYTSFDRGSDTDDVENVMDMYTSSSNGGGGSVCRRKGGHARANKKDNADDPTTSDYVQPSDDMNTGSSFADSSSPFLYDGMSPVEMPYKPLSDQNSLAANATRYDRIFYGDPHGQSFDSCATNDVKDDVISSDDDEEDDEEMKEHIRRLDQEAASKEREERECTEERDEKERRRRNRTTRDEDDVALSSGRRDARKEKSSPQEVGTMYALEVGLYIATGILLIFMMEQFVQIGVHIGKAGAFN